MTRNDSVDTIVIGAGVVGLAAARALAQCGHETLVLERHRVVGQETSSRNSGVIHAGIYYPQGSLKAQLCVRGKQLLYEFCAARGISHRRCGKLIVAPQSRIAGLEELRAKAIANGVNDIELLDAQQARELEPEVVCAAALLSPSTGIIDVHELMTGLLGDVEASGGVLVSNTIVNSLRPVADGMECHFSSAGESGTVTARCVINCAGLEAVSLAGKIESFPREHLPGVFYAKGSYFGCPGRPFSRLVYPMPEQAGLGIHATIDLNGNVRFGPDVEWVSTPDFNVDASRAEHFYAAIRQYWPSLPDGALTPDYAGIRPKIVGPGEAAADFVLQGPSDHGISGLVNAFGIESPGVTASLAIGEYIVKLLDEAD